jgi:hypothetical protein
MQREAPQGTMSTQSAVKAKLPQPHITAPTARDWPSSRVYMQWVREHVLSEPRLSGSNLQTVQHLRSGPNALRIGMQQVLDTTKSWENLARAVVCATKQCQAG